jgi:hypothetical protein
MVAAARSAAPAASGRPGRNPSPAPHRPGRTRRAWGALALTLALGSCAVPSAQPAGPGTVAPSPAPDRVAATRAGRAADPAGPRAGIGVPATPPKAAGFEVAEAPRRLSAPGPASPPARLAIAAIGVATPLVPLGRERDGSMQVPADFDRAGWFTGGPSPGRVGPAVIAGHIDSHRGPAVFYRLRELRPGDTVQVELADGARLRFVVEQARSFPKASFPTAEVFGPAPWAALRLVTCGGDFDRARGSYRDNLVVFARLARVTR